MVMPSVGVKWEMTDKWKRFLADEIESCVQPEHKPLLLSYTQGIEEAFFTVRKQLGYQADVVEIISDFAGNFAVHLNSQKTYETTW